MKFVIDRTITIMVLILIGISSIPSFAMNFEFKVPVSKSINAEPLIYLLAADALTFVNITELTYTKSGMSFNLFIEVKLDNDRSETIFTFRSPIKMLILNNFCVSTVGISIPVVVEFTYDKTQLEKRQEIQSSIAFALSYVTSLEITGYNNPIHLGKMDEFVALYSKMAFSDRIDQIASQISVFVSRLEILERHSQ